MFLKKFRKFKNAYTGRGQAVVQAGFSLIEIIIVIGIIATLMVIVVKNLTGGSDSAKLGINKTKAADLQAKLLNYQIQNGSFPSTEQGLQALTAKVGGVAIAGEDDLKDAWSRPFEYKLTTKGPLIISLGKDGQQSPESILCYLNGSQQDKCDAADVAQ